MSVQSLCVCVCVRVSGANLRIETMFKRRLGSVDLHSFKFAGLWPYVGSACVCEWVCVSGSPYGLKLCSNVVG